jgi:hypothetical protein
MNNVQNCDSFNTSISRIGKFRAWIPLSWGHFGMISTPGLFTLNPLADMSAESGLYRDAEKLLCRLVACMRSLAYIAMQRSCCVDLWHVCRVWLISRCREVVVSTCGRANWIVAYTQSEVKSWIFLSNGNWRSYCYYLEWNVCSSEHSSEGTKCRLWLFMQWQWVTWRSASTIISYACSREQEPLSMTLWVIRPIALFICFPLRTFAGENRRWRRWTE